MYDVLLVDIPYVEYELDKRLNEKIKVYRSDSESIIHNVTGIEAKEKAYYYSMGLLCLSTSAKEHIPGIRIKYYHYYLNNGSFAEYCKDVKLVVFSTMTVTFNKIIECCREVKKYNKNSKILLGGYHATYFAKDILEKYSFIDWIISYEGEIAFVELLKGIPFSDIKGLTYRDQNNKVNSNPTGGCILGEEIPMPDYSIIEPDIKYFNIQLQTMRGCIGKCNFCVNKNYWGSQRFRKIEDVISELKELKKKLPQGTVVHLIDNVFTLDKERLKKLYSALKNNDLLYYFVFECDTLATTVDKEIVEILDEMGVFKIGLGFEDCCEDVLKLAGKNNFFQKNVQAALQIKQYSTKICVYAYWLLGLPGTTTETLECNLKMIDTLIRDNVVDIVSPKIFIPYPGTEFYKNSEKYFSKSISDDWDNYERRNPPFPYKYKNISDKEIYDGLMEVFDICHKNYLCKEHTDEKLGF